MVRRTLSLKAKPSQGTPINDVIAHECRNCRFWDYPDDGPTTCRRRPPFIDMETRTGWWPSTDPDGWCGEFKRLPMGDAQ